MSTISPCRIALVSLFICVCAGPVSAYYSPNLGRWISRDPIEEQGGLNLYAAMLNNPATQTDYLGLGCSYSPGKSPYTASGYDKPSLYPRDIRLCDKVPVTLPIWPPGATLTIKVMDCQQEFYGDNGSVGTYCVCSWSVRQLCTKTCCSFWTALVSGENSYTEETVTMECRGTKYKYPVTYGQLVDFGLGLQCDCKPPTGTIPSSCCHPDHGYEVD